MNVNDITRNYPYKGFSWIAPLNDFTKRYGNQQLLPGVLTETDNYISEVENKFGLLTPEERTSVICVALILKEDILAGDNLFKYKKAEDLIEQVLATCYSWNVKPSEILTIGIERFAYLCRISSDDFDSKDILMEAPISWLDTLFAPLLRGAYRQVTAPSFSLDDCGRKKVIKF